MAPLGLRSGKRPEQSHFEVVMLESDGLRRNEQKDIIDGYARGS